MEEKSLQKMYFCGEPSLPPKLSLPIFPLIYKKFITANGYVSVISFFLL